MAIGYVTDGSLSLQKQEEQITAKERAIFARLTSVQPLEEPIDQAQPVRVNRVLFKRVKPDSTAPVSKLVLVASDGAASDDADVKAALAANKGVAIVWEGKVFANGKLAKVALVR